MMDKHSRLDFKNLFLGLILGVITTVGIAATSDRSLASGDEGKSSDPVRRFQLKIGEGNKAWILDKVTGQVWFTYYNELPERDPVFFGPKIEPLKTSNNR